MRILKPSLITSYCLNGLLGPHPLPEHLAPFLQSAQLGLELGADIYLLMEKDVVKWCEHWKRPSNAAADFLAGLENEQLVEFCSTVSTNLANAKTSAVATTSFFPELANQLKSKNDRFVETPVGRAIVNMILVADRLQQHRDRTIVQLVAGSVIDQFRVVKEKRTTRFHVGAGDSDSLIGLVLMRLNECLSAAQAKGSVDLNRIRIALELEPGPLFLLRDKKTLEKFTHEIENSKSEIIKKCIGFNLDIAHWWLSRDLKSANVLSEQVRSRIFGAHIAGHSPRGHFGDLGLAKLVARAAIDPIAKSQLDAYMGWLAALADEKLTPNSSTHVSIELEAAKPDEDIVQSVSVLHNWLRDVQG